MATHDFKVLFQGQLGNSVATIATVGGGVSWIVGDVNVVNTDSSDRTCAFYIGGTADVNKVSPTITIPAGGSAKINDVAWQLEATQTIAAGASVASKLTTTILGDEITP